MWKLCEEMHSFHRYFIQFSQSISQDFSQACEKSCEKTLWETCENHVKRAPPFHTVFHIVVCEIKRENYWELPCEKQCEWHVKTMWTDAQFSQNFSEACEKTLWKTCENIKKNRSLQKVWFCEKGCEIAIKLAITLWKSMWNGLTCEIPWPMKVWKKIGPCRPRRPSYS